MHQADIYPVSRQRDQLLLYAHKECQRHPLPPAEMKETLTGAAIPLGKARSGREDGTPNKLHCFRRCLRDLLEKRLRLFQIRRVKTLGKPSINFAKQSLCFFSLTMLLPETREARAGAQLQ